MAEVRQVNTHDRPGTLAFEVSDKGRRVGEVLYSPTRGWWVRWYDSAGSGNLDTVDFGDQHEQALAFVHEHAHEHKGLPSVWDWAAPGLD